MSLIVQKFGGSSVRDAQRIRNAAGIIAETYLEGNDVLVVLSAQGDTTDDLIAKAEEINSHPSKREMDMLLATGEQISVALCAMALESMGLPCVSLTAWQVGIQTTAVHGDARIKRIDSERVQAELDQHRIVLITGFQGMDRAGDVTTLGRGGSDTTAVAIAAKLGCSCEIYTDVDAVYTVDPRIYPPARARQKISYDEMMEMSALGAGVLETRCVELAKKYQVDLYLGRTLEEERKGTTVMSQPVFFEDMPVTGISIKEHCAIVTFRHMEYNAGTAASIFALIARNNLNLDMINQTILDGKVAFSFSCSDEQASELEAHLKEDPDASALVLDIRRDLTQLSLVGVGMATHTGVATQVFDTLARCGIPYYQITTSEISISFTIDPQNKEKAVQALAQAFHL